MADFPGALGPPASPGGGGGGGGSLIGNLLASTASSIAKAINNISLALSSIISTKTPTSMQIAITGVKDYPLGATPLMATSGSVSNTNAIATLPINAGSTVWITGFDVTGMGANTSGVAFVVVSGTHNNMDYVIAIPGNNNVSIEPLSIRYNPPIPANDGFSNITVTVSPFGAGSTDSCVTAYGFYV